MKEVIINDWRRIDRRTARKMWDKNSEILFAMSYVDIENLSGAGYMVLSKIEMLVNFQFDDIVKEFEYFNSFNPSHRCNFYIRVLEKR